MYAVEMRKITKRFGSFTANDQIDFLVKKGEIHCLLGENGAGKTTLMNVLFGLYKADEGELKINGKEIKKHSARNAFQCGLGMVHQHFMLVDALTVWENVVIGNEPGKFSINKKEAIKKVQELSDKYHFDLNAEAKVADLSIGMKQRVEILKTLYRGAEILILDEPTAVLTPQEVLELLDIFRDIRKQGKTIIFVSHDLSSISKYCDRVVLLNKGDKMSEGAPKEMINLYKRVLLNQTVSGQDGKVLQENEEQGSTETKLWKSHYKINPGVDEYGTGEAEIIDFAIIDEHGSYTNCIEKGTSFAIKSKVLFNQEIQNPIFTLTCKNIQGTAVTGTNTMYEKVDVGTVHPGEVYVATFEQNMDMQGGEYLLSISCTGYADGNFKAYHRLYDVCGITVVSDKNTVGFYDMNSQVSVERIR